MITKSLAGHLKEYVSACFTGIWITSHEHEDAIADYSMHFDEGMAAGRSEAVKKRVGDALLEQVKRHFEPVFARRHIGVTLQIDESPGQVYDAKHSSLHPLFNK